MDFIFHQGPQGRSIPAQATSLPDRLKYEEFHLVNQEIFSHAYGDQGNRIMGIQRGQAGKLEPAHQGAQQGQHHSQTQPPTMMQGMLSPLFPPPLYPQDGGQGYQPMFPMVHFPPPTPVYVGFPVMAHPIPPPIHQFPQQPHPGGTKAPGNQRPELQQADSHNSAPVTSTPALTPAPQSPRDGLKTKEISEFERPKDWDQECWKEFEAARGFEDDYIYFPNDEPE
ncbi:hypothetical protein F5B17DRAFT_452074 [Nemania serpens]|nr:hypothetical protein F5B17DRAFT_452074 [Nemania serpens]